MKENKCFIGSRVISSNTSSRKDSEWKLILEPSKIDTINTRRRRATRKPWQWSKKKISPQSPSPWLHNHAIGRTEWVSKWIVYLSGGCRARRWVALHWFKQILKLEIIKNRDSFRKNRVCVQTQLRDHEKF